MLNMLESRVITKATLETAAAGVLHAAPDRAVPGPHLSAAVRRPDLGQHASADAALAEPDRHDHRAVSRRSRPARLHAPGDASTSGIPATSTTSATSATPFRSSPRRRCIATPRRTSTRSTNFPRRGRDWARRCCTPARGRAAGGVWPTPASTCTKPIMAVLNLSVKYREQMQYNKYRAARDTIEKFEKEPPFAYEIPREQHDAPTAALLMEKLMLQGIEVHQSTKPDAWVILMDQPFCRPGEGTVRAADVSGAVAAALRRHRLDAAVPDGRRSPRHDDAAHAGVSRFAARR